MVRLRRKFNPSPDEPRTPIVVRSLRQVGAMTPRPGATFARKAARMANRGR